MRLARNMTSFHLESPHMFGRSFVARSIVSVFAKLIPLCGSFKDYIIIVMQGGVWGYTDQQRNEGVCTGPTLLPLRGGGWVSNFQEKSIM